MIRPDARNREILFVALQTGANANGGISSFGHIVCNLRRHRGHVLTNLDTNATASWRSSGLAVTVVRESASKGWRRAPLSTLATYWRYFAVVRRYLLASGCRLVHANDPLAFQLCLAAVRSVRSTAIVLNIRDTLPPDRPPPTRRYQWIFTQAAHVFFLSEDMRARWSRIAPVVQSRSTTTYSVVDRTIFRPSPVPKQEPAVVLLSGVLCPKKGQLDFIEKVAPTLAAAGVETWLSGDLDRDVHYTHACRRAAKPLGSMVHFLGYRSDVAALVERSRVVAVSSHFEGLMRTMIEAMAAGRPVVSSDVCSAREMLERRDMKAGAVFPIGCGSGMAEAILNLCRDWPAADQLGRNAARIADRYFTTERVVTLYEDVYARVLDAA